MEPYEIRFDGAGRSRKLVFRCDWMRSPAGDRMVMHLPGPPGEASEAAIGRGLSAVAARLRALAGDYDIASRLATDPAFREAREATVRAFSLDMAEQEIASGLRCEVTGEFCDDGDDDAR